ncbi:MAG: type II secretion system secretin GspD [Byssovorax sp.]
MLHGSRLRRLLTAPLAAAILAALAAPASAQPATRGAPVLKTPGRKPDPTGTTPPSSPAPSAPAGGSKSPPPMITPPGGGKPAPAGGTGGASGGAAGGGEDPMNAANVKMGPKEIDFKPKPGGFGVNFNLDDADLPDLVKAISNITGKRFIYGGKLRSIKATVYSPEKVSAAEAYSAFLSILDTNGMTVIPHGRFLKIIEAPGVVQDTTEIYGTASPVPNEDRYITRLYRLSHIDATEASNVLSKFKTKEGDITVYPASNLLIITETGSNIQRMLRIIEEIDVGSAGEQIYVEPLNYTSAADVATKLNDLLDLKKGGTGGGAASGGKGGGGGGGGGGARIVADEKGNALIVIATDPDYRRLIELINRIDVKQTGEGEIRVSPLQYASCKDLSQTLNQILGTSAAGGIRPGGATGAVGTGTATGARVPGAAGAGVDEVFEGRIRVTCDEATNSLVTTSSVRDYAQLRNVIDKLDHPRRQVFIEAVIMDVSVDRSTDVGLGYHGGAPFSTLNPNDSAVFGGFNPAASAISGLPSNLEALAVGVRGPAIEGADNLFGTGISIPALGVVMHALAKDGDSNVLATPHILATDNVPAEISIGQNIPLQTNIGGGLGALGGLAGATGATGATAGLGALGALGGLGGLGGFGFQAQRQDIGTKIKVTPHVNDSDQVRLELVEEISDAGAPLGSLGAIPINKRTANTTLVVRDQQTVVIGGLVRDAITNGETKIPILGDIPVLGLLFKQTQRKKTKSNLLLVLTPYVIRDQDDLRAIFERKMQERQEFLDRYFVFSDVVPWQPPRDYARANGLVEDIRQAMLNQDEKQRLELERAPKARKSHEPGQPIPLPSLGGRGGTAGDDGGGAPPPSAPAGGRSKIKINPSGLGTATPSRGVDRTE